MLQPSALPVAPRSIVSVARETTRAHLRRHQLFENVDDLALRECSEIFTIVRYAPGKRFFHEGDRVERVYLLTQGCVGLSRMSESGKEITTAVIGAGGSFGEDALFGAAFRRSQAMALDESVVCSASGKTFALLMNRFPRLSLNLARCSHYQREEAFATVMGFARLTVSERLSALLVRLAEEYGVPDGSGLRIELRLTHACIASLIGSTRETVSTEISRLVRAGFISLSGRAFVVRR